jgi:HAD superfamily hydrolase (TIGR01509 family)
MNIIIPLGGKGERFYKEGFTQPKPLIGIFNKPMIYYVLDNLNLNADDKVFIIYSSELDRFDFTTIVTKKYSYIQFIPLMYQTTGAVETIYAGLAKIISLSSHKKCVLLDCDTFYTQDILSVIRKSTDNMVLFTKKIDEKPLYSYINMDTNNKITDIKEKVKISSNANTGCYVFDDIIQLHNFCKYVLENKITFNGEPYTSCVIQEMIKNKNVWYGHELNEQCVFSLGTPKELNTFINNSYVFLFDLDGTLVNTDNIYVKVWKQILAEYNIDLTLELFHKYIHGNSDDKVVNILIPSANVNQISLLKDKLFIENIKDVTLIDGMYDFIKLVKTKGYNCSIVTNCNRDVAEAIIDYCKLTKMIDFIVVGNECSRSKPYPDPYIDAINKYNVDPNKVIIFEDSKSGLLSARQTNPSCIVGVTTSYSRSELLKLGANIVIDNYTGFVIEEIISFNNFSVQHLEKHIRNSLNIEIINIEFDDKKLKGG